MTYEQLVSGGRGGQYFRKSEPPAEVKAGYWKAAFGLQQVDGLVPSQYAVDLACRNVAGDLTLPEVADALDEYHASGDASLAPRTEEADKVSQRIVRLLADGWFDLSLDIVAYIHHELFAGIDDQAYQPGAYKDDLYFKCEPILNGDSVMYVAPGYIARFLAAAFDCESRHRYDLFPGTRSYLTWADASNLADFIARIWGAHPFLEGNTRTVAVFCELYLRNLGIDVDNTVFEQDSTYFRNALVRSNYANPQLGVTRTCDFLMTYLSKLVEDCDLELDADGLWCVPLFAHPESVRNVPLVDASPMQEELRRQGVTEWVLAFCGPSDGSWSHTSRP